MASAPASGQASAKQDELPGNVTEILNDLTHIGRASVDIERRRQTATKPKKKPMPKWSNTCASACS